MKLPVALQLYSVRDAFSNDLMGTLKEVKEMGYCGVEIAGFGPHGAEAFKAALDEVGLKCISAHVPYDVMLAEPEKVFAEYKSVGCEYVAIPWLDLKRAPGGEDFMQTIPNIERLGKIAKEQGLTFLYHNHDFEFRKMGEKYGLDVLFEEVPAEYLQTQIDTCWVKLIGLDPAEYLRKYTGRAPLVHIKDFSMSDANDKSTFSFQYVGGGVQDVPAILQASLDIGASWVIVEYDRPPSGLTPMETARKSREYLKTLGW